MSDEDVVKGEEKKARIVRWERLTESIRREWNEAGYIPWQHLEGVTGEGDTAVLGAFHGWERTKLHQSATLGCYMAVTEINEIAAAIRSHRLAKQPPAPPE